MAPTTGRKQIAPGQIIASAGWGNPLWDQSVQCFNSAADRAAQYPTPHAGAITWLEDRGRLEKWIGGRWEQLPPAAFIGNGCFLQIVPYVGQPVTRVTGNQTVTTDASGQVMLLTAGSIGGGILGMGLNGSSTFCINTSFITAGNNLYAKLFNGITQAANTSIAVTWWVDCYGT
jgi:hypothetical protein